jgi:hypothetical protein
MLPCRVLLPGGMRGGSPKAGRTSAANRASVGVQSNPRPASLAVVLLASRAYYQWPVDKSRRAEEKSVGCHLGSGSMVAHDSDDVTALGDFFQISIPVAILSVDLDECILAPNSFRLLLILVDMPDK